MQPLVGRRVAVFVTLVAGDLGQRVTENLRQAREVPRPLGRGARDLGGNVHVTIRQVRTVRRQLDWPRGRAWPYRRGPLPWYRAD